MISSNKKLKLSEFSSENVWNQNANRPKKKRRSETFWKRSENQVKILYFSPADNYFLQTDKICEVGGAHDQEVWSPMGPWWPVIRLKGQYVYKEVTALV